MTTKQRPQAETVVEEMRAEGDWHTKNLTQTVFYKLLPFDDNKDKVTEIIGDANWDAYTHFKEVDNMYITASQFNRLLDSAENKEDLESYGVVARST